MPKILQFTRCFLGGYDAYRNCFIFGYNLYQVNSWSTQHKYELPVYLMMVTGSRHDSVSGMFAVNRTIKGMGYGVDNGCFDTAHDATGFYRLCRDLWNMRPFVPLNTTNKGNIKNLPMASITKEGIPVCQAGRQMYVLLLIMVEWYTHIQRTIRACIRLFPGHPRNGRIHMTTELQQRESSSERRTTLSLLLSELVPRSDSCSILF